MGAVWRAHDEVLGRDVALKEVCLPSGASPQDAASWNARTLREARSAARLRHPGIIAIHDVVQHDERPWIVMELIDGRSLDALIDGGPPRTPEYAARIGAQILDALRTAHAAGIVHRDIKPANILLDDERVVVTDFGIARVEDDTVLTRTGTVLGTPSYMSPEQASGRPVTPASDLWSLGVTLYALLEGHPPFTGPNAAAVIAAILTQEPDPPRRAGTPLATVLAGLLIKDPAKRITAEQAAAGLTAVAAGHPAVNQRGPGVPPRPVPPPGSPHTARTFVEGEHVPGRPVDAAHSSGRRTFRAPWIAAAAALVAVVLTVAGYFAFDHSDREQTRLASAAESIGAPPGFTREGSHDKTGGRLRVDYTRHCPGCKGVVLNEVMRWLTRQPGIEQVVYPADGCAASGGCGWQWSRGGTHIEASLTPASNETYSLRITLG